MGSLGLLVHKGSLVSLAPRPLSPLVFPGEDYQARLAQWDRKASLERGDIKATKATRAGTVSEEWGPVAQGYRDLPVPLACVVSTVLKVSQA